MIGEYCSPTPPGSLIVICFCTLSLSHHFLLFPTLFRLVTELKSSGINTTTISMGSWNQIWIHPNAFPKQWTVCNRIASVFLLSSGASSGSSPRDHTLVALELPGPSDLDISPPAGNVVENLGLATQELTRFLFDVAPTPNFYSRLRQHLWTLQLISLKEW